MRRKIESAPAIRLSPPNNCAAARVASANPPERLARLRGVGILLVIDEKFAVPLIHPVAGFLDGLVFIHPLAVAHAAVAYLPFGHVLGVIRIRINRSSRFQDEGLQSLLAQ